MKLSDDDLNQLIQRERLSQEHLSKAGSFASFAPLKYQQPWFKCDKKIILLMCGNQVGKTTFGVVKMISAALGCTPPSLGGQIPAKWWDNKCRGKRYLICGESYGTSLRDTILPKMHEFIGPGMLVGTPKKNAQGLDSLFKFSTGATIVIGSYEQGRDAFEGPVWDGFWGDEPPPQPVFSAVRRGTLARQGFMIITGTPLKEPWMLDELILPAQDEDHPSYGTVGFFRASMHDNCLQCSPGVGLIEHFEIESFLSTQPPKERQAREHGDFIDLMGREFTELDRAIHVIPDIF